MKFGSSGPFPGTPYRRPSWFRQTVANYRWWLFHAVWLAFAPIMLVRGMCYLIGRATNTAVFEIDHLWRRASRPIRKAWRDSVQDDTP